MADIAMCQDKKCPSRTLCYRYTAERCQYAQSYFAKSPREKGNVRCENFWSNSGTPDPTDDSVSTYKTPMCKCDAFRMDHPWTPYCQLFEIVKCPQKGAKRAVKGRISRKKRRNTTKSV